MSLSSSTVSITQYKINGKFESHIIDTVADGLSRNTIKDIDQQVIDNAAGWTSFEKPFQPDFS
ncbi:MAG: exonuclease, partial [Desulfobacterales bacterium]